MWHPLRSFLTRRRTIVSQLQELLDLGRQLKEALANIAGDLERIEAKLEQHANGLTADQVAEVRGMLATTTAQAQALAARHPEPDPPVEEPA